MTSWAKVRPDSLRLNGWVGFSNTRGEKSSPAKATPRIESVSSRRSATSMPRRAQMASTLMPFRQHAETCSRPGQPPASPKAHSPTYGSSAATPFARMPPHRAPPHPRRRSRRDTLSKRHRILADMQRPRPPPCRLQRVEFAMLTNDPWRNDADSATSAPPHPARSGTTAVRRPRVAAIAAWPCSSLACAHSSAAIRNAVAAGPVRRRPDQGISKPSATT